MMLTRAATRQLLRIGYATTATAPAGQIGKMSAAMPSTANTLNNGKNSSNSSGSAADRVAWHASAFPVRQDWTREEITSIYNLPLLDLAYLGATAHRQHFNAREVQQCTLLSIKTGGCAENCSYCPQSSTHKGTGVAAQKLMAVDDVVAAAKQAKEAGSTRFCMGAAWREVTGKWQFEQVLSMVRQVRAMDLEVCCTLGMLKADHAKQLKEAGLTAYNHNLDTSREYYPSIITTRNYDDRLQTLAHVRQAGISVCCGGIIGLGEGETDRIGLIHTLATLPEHPESVPVNALVPVDGTPLAKQQKVSPWELVRMIATVRVVMPRSIVRLSAGRISLSAAEQALCFFAGANSIFTGDKLLTTKNNDKSDDAALFALLGLQGKAPDFDQGAKKEEGKKAAADDEEEDDEFASSCSSGSCSGGCSSKTTATRTSPAAAAM